MRARFRQALTIIATVAILAFISALPAFAAMQEPAPEPVAEAPVEPVQEPAEPDAVAEPSEPAQAEEASDSDNVEPEPVEPVQPVEEAAPEPEPAPAPEPVTIGDLFAGLESAITARDANGVTVAAAERTLNDARDALVSAEDSLAAAMQGQGQHVATVRGAAQALVDALTAAYLLAP